MQVSRLVLIGLFIATAAACGGSEEGAAGGIPGVAPTADDETLAATATPPSTMAIASVPTTVLIDACDENYVTLRESLDLVLDRFDADSVAASNGLDDLVEPLGAVFAETVKTCGDQIDEVMSEYVVHVASQFSIRGPGAQSVATGFLAAVCQAGYQLSPQGQSACLGVG